MKKLITLLTILMLSGCAHDVTHQRINTSNDVEWLCSKWLFNRSSIGSSATYYVEVFKEEIPKIKSRVNELGYRCDKHFEAVRIDA